MGVRYKCSYCEKPFIGDYGQEGKLFVWCSEQCEKDWRDRFAKNAKAYMKLMGKEKKDEGR
jgi:hypothetical protein